MRPLACIVLAAGKGTRMKSALPKVLHPVGGRPMLGHLLAALEAASVSRTVVVVAPGQDAVGGFARAHKAEVAVQAEQKGTADAARAASAVLAGFEGDALVLYADNPLLTPGSLERLRAERARGADLVLMGFRPADPGPYGRLVERNGQLEAIVEAKDASAAQRAIGFCNAGGFLLDAKLLFALLAEIRPHNAQGEYYLTDIVGLARSRSLSFRAVEVPADDVLGVNSRAELAAVEAVFQQRMRRRAMEEGATLTDPASVFFSFDTRLGRDVTVGPHVVFGPGVVVADEVTIRPFCHLEGARVERGAVIGPFARLRPGTHLHEDVHIGNFVETKAATLGKGAKANHLTYLGDAAVGAGANIGAGTITCNYDGFDKHRTEIGAGAFVGSNSALVAPVKVGEGAYVGAGSVITKDVSAGALAVERSKQTEAAGWAGRFREKKRAEKAARGKKS